MKTPIKIILIINFLVMALVPVYIVYRASEIVEDVKKQVPEAYKTGYTDGYNSCKAKSDSAVRDAFRDKREMEPAFYILD